MRAAYRMPFTPGCSGFFSPGRIFMLSCSIQMRAVVGLPSTGRSTLQMSEVAPAANSTFGASRQLPFMATFGSGNSNRNSGRIASPGFQPRKSRR